jgi:T5orf172 domain
MPCVKTSYQGLSKESFMTGALETFQKQAVGRPKHGFVYFLQVDAYGFVKIGFTAGLPAVRCRAIQQSSPFILHWIGQYPAVAEEERILHKRFSQYRLRNEWFFPVAPLMEFIEEKCPNFDAQAEKEAIFRFDVLERFKSLNTQTNRATRRMFDKHIQRFGVSRWDLTKWREMTEAPDPRLVHIVEQAVNATCAELAAYGAAA